MVSYSCCKYRGIAQLVEYWSPKPWVVGSSPSAPAMKKAKSNDLAFFNQIRRWRKKSHLRGMKSDFVGIGAADLISSEAEVGVPRSE